MNERLQQLNQATSILTWIKTIYPTQMNHRIQRVNQATSIWMWIKTIHPDSLITTVLSHPWLIWGWWLTCAVCCQLVLLFSQMAQPSDSTVTIIHHYRLKLSESQMVYPLSDTTHCFQVTCRLLCFGKSYPLSDTAHCFLVTCRLLCFGKSYSLSDTAHCFQVTRKLLCFGKSCLEVTLRGWQDVKILSLTNFIAKNNNAYHPRERKNYLHGQAEEQASHHHQAILSL